MSRKLSIVILGFFIICSSFLQFSSAIEPGEVYEESIVLTYRNITVYAPAVAETDNGYVGVISTITVTLQSNGSGRVFVDTLPLTQIDMQGSARLSVKVASALVKNDDRCNINPDEYDFFFVVRTSSPIIGGPSAGGIMTAAVVSLLENWTMDNKTVMTGMINPDGSIGPIGGILQKIDAAYFAGATRFLLPKGQMTYIEMITETTMENGWTQTISKPVTKNVAEYALENYGMEAVEVEDINEALLYFTGWEFPTSESNESITTEDYINSMEPLATNLLENARTSYANASDSFDNSTIPNRRPDYYKNQVTDFLNNAHERLIDSENWYEQEVYYTSTSKSFQSLIDSHFVTYACNYFSVDDKQDYVNSILNEAKEYHSNKSSLAKNAEVNGTISLQCVGAGQKRASDADSYLSDAESNYQRGDYLTALYKISYAMQRSESIEWWLGISIYFNDTGDITADELTTLAGEYIEDAQQSVVYSSVILEEMGRSSSYLSDAEGLLELARNDKENGYSAAAFFEALEALVKANLALEIVNGVDDDKIKRAQESASASIAESRTRGVEPVLAVSYYEYAESLVNESSEDIAMVYYKYSGIIAGALGYTSTCSGQSSRYIGVPPKISISPWSQIVTKYFGFFVFFAIVGGIGGIGIGILISAATLKKPKHATSSKKLKQVKIDDYYRKQTKYFSGDEIPKSIKDYYKNKD
jgi:uncharacterized protein